MVKGHLSVFLLLVVSSLCLAKDDAGKQPVKKQGVKKVQTLSRGWGDNLEWVQTYEEGLYKAKSTNRPLMVINHREDCPHSLALKKSFAEHKGVQKMAEQFVLLNVVHDPTDKNLLLDGHYVPKIVFVGISVAKVNDKFMNGEAVMLMDVNNLVDPWDPLVVDLTDPSLVVRADLPGKYSNHRYTYEPTDIDHLFENMKKSLKLLKTEL